jgi:peptide/nickel transport system substrate-binding protein
MRFKSIFLAGALAFLPLLSPASANKANDTLTWTTGRELSFSLPYFVTSREQLIIESLSHDTLIYRTPKSGSYEPLLATSWKWVDDLTLEFQLRKDVVFHDGSPFGADDVVYTLKYVSAPDAGVVTRANVSWIKDVEKVDDFTVRIRTNSPFPAALEFLAGPNPIFPKGLFNNARKDAAGRPNYASVKPIGTGPYMITEQQPGRSVRLTRNERYFGGIKGRPAIKNVVFRTIADPQTQMTELLAGGVDWMWELSKDQADRLRDMGVVNVVSAPTMRVAFLQFDAAGKSGETPFKDLKVRQAVAHAVNREAITKALVGSSAEVIHAACYPSQFGCTSEVATYGHDLAKAKRLMSESGFPNGFQVDLLAYRDRNVAEALVADLAKIGIRANLRYLQYKAMVDLIWGNNAPLVFSTWGSSSMNDVSAITSHFFSGGRDDYCMDQGVTQALAQGDKSIDPEVRKSAYKRALTGIAEKACWLPLFAYSLDYAFSKELNFTPTADEIPQFYRASWK